MIGSPNTPPFTLLQTASVPPHTYEGNWMTNMVKVPPAIPQSSVYRREYPSQFVSAFLRTDVTRALGLLTVTPKST